MDAQDWLVQQVCVDAGGNVVSVDPYFCPQGDTLRPLQVGEPLPYFRHDQPSLPINPNGFQRHDSYPVLNLQGHQLVIHSRIPMLGPYCVLDQMPQYNVGLIDGNWLSTSETRDNSGFSQTFFGANGSLGNGWVYFPNDIFGNPQAPSSGSAYMPINGVYWEQSGMPSPGDLPAHYLTKCLTSWKFVPAFPFGGLGGCPVKHIDTIVSTHGYVNTPDFFTQGHLEVTYFTQLYGETRWEEWRPVQQHVATMAPGRCLGSSTMAYMGTEFNLTDARDWSAITVTSAPALPPAVLIPDNNLLQNWHFNVATIAPWTGSALDWSLCRSVAPLDIAYATNTGEGVRYLVIRTSGTSGYHAIWQDIPVTKITNGASYAFGANIRSESGAGKLTIELTQVNSGGTPIAGTECSIAATVGPEIGGFTENGKQVTAADSIVLSSRFFVQTAAIKFKSTAVALRFSLSPQTAGAYDVVDAWVVPR